MILKIDLRLYFLFAFCVFGYLISVWCECFFAFLCITEIELTIEFYNLNVPKTKN